MWPDLEIAQTTFSDVFTTVACYDRHLRAANNLLSKHGSAPFSPVDQRAGGQKVGGWVMVVGGGEEVSRVRDTRISKM